MAACRTIFSRVSSFINCPSFLQIRKPLPCYQQCASVKTKDFPKLGLSPPPKRPLVPFFKFKQMFLPKLKAENPTVKQPNLLKLLSVEWEKYPPEKKELLQKEAESEFTEYRKDIENYRKNLTPEEIEIIAEVRRKIKHNKELRVRRQKRIDLDKPKKPLSAYALYFREKKSHADKSMSQQEFMKALSHEWKTESYETKKKYRIEYQNLKTEYKQKLKEWEDKMIKLGNLDVLGTKTLRKLHREYKEKDRKSKGEEIE